MDDQHLITFREQYTAYAQRLLFDLGLDSLAQPLRGQLLTSIDAYISQVLTATILENLDDDSVIKIDELLAKNKPQDEVIAYLIASMPGIGPKISEALEKAYGQILEEVRQLTTDTAKQFAKTETNSSSDQSNSDIPSGIDENPAPESSIDKDGNLANSPQDQL